MSIRSPLRESWARQQHWRLHRRCTGSYTCRKSPLFCVLEGPLWIIASYYKLLFFLFVYRLTSTVRIHPIKRPHESPPGKKGKNNRYGHAPFPFLQRPPVNQGRRRQEGQKPQETAIDSILRQSHAVTLPNVSLDCPVGESASHNAPDQEAGARREIEQPADKTGGQMEPRVEDFSSRSEKRVLEEGEEPAGEILRQKLSVHGDSLSLGGKMYVRRVRRLDREERRTRGSGLVQRVALGLTRPKSCSSCSSSFPN